MRGIPIFCFLFLTSPIHSWNLGGKHKVEAPVTSGRDFLIQAESRLKGNNGKTSSFSINEKKDSESSGMEVTLSAIGLEYAKEVLVGRVLDEIVPLQVPDIEATTVTYFGTVVVSLKNINLTNAEVGFAAIDLDNGNITVFAQGIEANLTFEWKYVYAGWFGDSGLADIKASGIKAGVNFNLTAKNGTLEMSVLQHGAILEKISIVLHNYYSWLYNWLMTSFHNHLRAAIESAISEGILRASLKLNNYLQSFPRLIPVDATSAIDATISRDPKVQQNLLSFSPRGEFVGLNQSEKERGKFSPKSFPRAVLCGQEEKMIAITVTDFMVNSASQVYYQAGSLSYSVEELPDSSLIKLNTASWRFILPGLYRQYPHQDMALYFLPSAPPLVNFAPPGLSVAVEAEMIIQVLQLNSTLDVASVWMRVLLSGWAGMRGNNLTSSVQLNSLDLNLKWSKIGNVPVHTLQLVTKSVMKGVIIPLANRKLMTGFPLPVVPTVKIENATIFYGENFLSVCTNLEYTGGLFAHL